MKNKGGYKWLGAVLLGGIILFCLPLSIFSQEHMGKGRISGTVVDGEGNPLEDVLIVVESVNYDTKLTGRTDENGHFAVAGMGTGMWQITASKQGYTSSSVKKRIKQLERNPPIDFTLQKVSGFGSFLEDKESMELFDKGNEFIQKKQYDEALEIFDKFKEKYPKVYQVHLNIGTCYLKKGDIDKAEEEFNYVLDKILESQGDYKEEKATSFRAFIGLGKIYIKKGDFNQAQEYFAQALEISPEDEISAYNVGEVYFSNQKIDQAIKYFKMAIQIKKDWPKPYRKLGYAYLNKGEYDKALEYFRKFLEMAPDSPQAPQVKNIIETIEKMK
ncbi:tetratricopeptide repeat protein [bacterium]|nr:tetratricopeptide repeat protein [bacterium]